MNQWWLYQKIGYGVSFLLSNSQTAVSRSCLLWVWEGLLQKSYWGIVPEWSVAHELFLSKLIGQLLRGWSVSWSESEIRDIPCFRGGLRGGRCTKFEVNQTNLNRVILDSVSSSVSGCHVTWGLTVVWPVVVMTTKVDTGGVTTCLHHETKVDLEVLVRSQGGRSVDGGGLPGHRVTHTSSHFCPWRWCVYRCLL